MARSAEIDRLRAALARAATGTAGAVLMSGDAGVGKSRLLDELVALARSEGAVVLTGRCLDVGESGLPYLPFAEAIADAFPDGSADALRSRPALARLLPGMAAGEPATSSSSAESGPLSSGRTLLADTSQPVPIGPGGRRRPEPDMAQLQLFDAVHSLLTELSEQGCVLLAIEDLHWADGSTRDLLSFLLARLRTQQLLVVATYRSDDLHRRHPLRPLLAELFRLPAVERLDLAPFTPADTRAFITALAEEALPEDLVQQAVQRSEGNPFFAEELVAALADCGADALPAALADVLLSRVERLSPPAQQVVRVAAVAGPRVRYSRLPAVAGLPELELEEALREAVQHNVLVTVEAENAYAFRHALLAEAVYSDLLPGERVRLHAAYARLLAREVDAGTPGAAAELAHHALQSKDLPMAFHASVQAADEAGDVGAPAEALGHIEGALELLHAVANAEPGEFVLLRRASHYAISSGDPERAIAYARSAVRAADQAGIPEKAALARRILVQSLFSLDGTEAEATRIIEEAWDLLKDREPSETSAWVLATLGAIQKWNVETLPQARESVENAVRIARLTGARGAEADALITLASIENNQGRLELADQRLLEARDRAVEAGALTAELRVLFVLATGQYEQARFDEALRTFDEGVRRAKETGLSLSPYGLVLRAHQAAVKYVTGDWDGAQEAAEAFQDVDFGLAGATVASAGLPVLVGRGVNDAAERLIARLRAGRYPDTIISMLTSAAGAELECWRGRPERAVELVDEGLRRFAELGEPWMLGGIRLAALGIAAAADLAERARRRRGTDAEQQAKDAGSRLLTHARTTVEKGKPRTGEMGPEGLAWIARVEAEASRLDGAGDPKLWAAVVEGFGYGHRYEQALARWRLAGALLATEHRDDAAAELRQAQSMADQLGAAPLAKAIAELARRGRIGLAHEQAGPAGAGGQQETLTPRELAVLHQVALGQTNRQVGEQLYISEKTVSVHLSRVMAKLGAGSRTEAVAIAYDRGLLTTG
ncbi:helix-turn-helix transcriptional regulator [Flindersiella endophytica]